MATKYNDLFLSTLRDDLHNEAPKELLKSMRESLRHIKDHNPNSAQTAEACLAGLASDSSTLLHVLTAAYLINGGVMLKHPVEEPKELTIEEVEEELKSLMEDHSLASRGDDPPRPPSQPRARPSSPRSAADPARS